MSEVIDNQSGKLSSSGVIALQLHQGSPTKVEFKDIELSTAGALGGSPTDAGEAGKSLVGKPSVQPAAEVHGGQSADVARRHHPLRILAGERPELIQQDTAKGHMSSIRSGNPHWTDYDFAVELMRDSGDCAANIFIRESEHGESAFVFVVGGTGACWIEVWPERRGRKDVPSEGPGVINLVNKKWYTVGVRVRGNRYVCSIYDEGRELVSLDLKNDLHQGGRVGIIRHLEGRICSETSKSLLPTVKPCGRGCRSYLASAGGHWWINIHCGRCRKASGG